MELIARVGERVERVTIEREAARYRIRVGGRERLVEPRSLGLFVRSLLVDGESHEAAVFRVGVGTWRVGWRGRTTTVEIVDPLTHLAEAAHGESPRSGRTVVTAYMPGRVVAVHVTEGEAVQPGSPLIVLEAMKMQNEIQSDRAARVRKVHVDAGEAVEGGDPLVELE